MLSWKCVASALMMNFVFLFPGEKPNQCTQQDQEVQLQVLFFIYNIIIPELLTFLNHICHSTWTRSNFYFLALVILRLNIRCTDSKTRNLKFIALNWTSPHFMFVSSDTFPTEGPEKSEFLSQNFDSGIDYKWGTDNYTNNSHMTWHTRRVFKTISTNQKYWSYKKQIYDQIFNPKLHRYYYYKCLFFLLLLWYWKHFYWSIKKNSIKV